MTCIVGLEEDGVVYIGGDSAGVDSGWGLTVRADEKVFIRERSGDPWIFGFCGSFRMGQLLRYTLELPEPETGDDLYEFMVTKFVDAVRFCLTNGGALYSKNGREEGGTFLVGYRGQLFCVEEDMQVGRSVAPFVAIGCGDHLATGAMHALHGYDTSPKKKITAALKAAEQYSAGVRGPFVILDSSGKPARPKAAPRP